ncbi:helix-turn-helix transcriptional regulator [Natronomonas salsuginis]|uniref:Helix-turn-helix transcriptional regulator n=1 Tax=Natronomonas salsuginis TaxID=2217661 RepID=A0A4V6XUQ0_9EURY|nr:helix-turn-helix transcriptional regulator [Natronomonas salsuginis]
MSDAQPDRTRDDKGRFQASASPNDVFQQMEPLEPYSTNEIADRLGLPHRTALHYLNQLAENNRIRKKKPGKRSVIWVRME